MRKPMDLNSLISSYKSLSLETFNQIMSFSEFELKIEEVEQISKFIKNLKIQNKYFCNFYLGYTIPQIGKEFDLLRFGKNYILNVEIKSILKMDDAKEQLIKNRYYLASLGKKMKTFTYVANTNILYQLDDDENFQEVDFNVLEKLLISQKLEHFSNIDDLFDPTDYLVSPFNDSEKFINGSYFLTNQQKEFKINILKNPEKFNIIEGLPGTGKTLLLYDLAKEYNSRNEVVIFHTGILNEGHLILNQQYHFNILPIKDIKRIQQINPEIIFVDETQRMRPHQLEYLIKYVKEKNIFCIFTIDPKQVLSIYEWDSDNKSKLLELEDCKVYKLSKRIRTNKELGTFIKGLFNLNDMGQCKNTDNISIHYFDDIGQARGFAIGLENEGWQVIDYIGQRWDDELIEKMMLHRGLNAHSVVGQEFDKVLVLVGPTFHYREDGCLTVSERNYYDSEGMFYHSVTRARKQLMLLIVNNPNFMTNLMGVLNKNMKK